LLFHLPARWEDRTTVATVAEARAAGEGDWTLQGRLAGLRRVFTRRWGFQVVHGVLRDASGEIPVVWFNRPLASFKLADGEYLLHGPVRRGKSEPEMVSPSCEPVERALHGGRITPVYPAIRGIGAPLLRRLFDGLLGEIDLAAPGVVPEPLPDDLLARHGLPTLGEALAALHRPDPESDAAVLNSRRSPAHLRLIYGELLEFQLALAVRRAAAVSAPKPHRCRVDDRIRAAARAALPFRLTGAQKRVLREIVEDLQAPRPMMRLLQGDVGSGKTVVAALALVVALENGFQGAFLAPTELLAEQHFASLERLLGGRYRITLLTGSLAPAAAAARRAALAAGEVQLAVGTHALLEERVAFRALGLAVIDEQHRFGVEQRRALSLKGAGRGGRPDLLVMTATPIPRSLALAAYGDLDVSTLDELPPGRSAIATEVLPVGRRRAVYAQLRRALDAGARAYVVVPRIEEGEGGAVSIEEAAERVGRDLSPHPVAVLHGRLPLPDRTAALAAFSEGTVRVLVATTVIEVGIDVPEATWMVIESAERFGLAQLHQLRGRVGRGPTPSRCVALVGKASGRTAPESGARLEAFAATTDGFQLAEADLALRGAGDLLGTRQAGLPPLRVADLAADREWLERARDDARELLDRMQADGRTAPRLAEMMVAIEGTRG
jgi:ATP-dependent DNA helicase RecG